MITLLKVLRFTISVFSLMLFIFLLYQPRSKNSTLWVVISCFGLVIPGNVLLMFLIGLPAYSGIFPVTLTIPVALLMLLFSKHRGWRFLYSYTSMLSFGCIVLQMGLKLSEGLFHGSILADTIIRCVVIAVLLVFIAKVFRPAYFSMLEQLDRGWPILCIGPTAYLVFFVVFTVQSLVAGGLMQISLSLVSAALLLSNHAISFLFFQQVRATLENEEKNRLLEIGEQRMKARYHEIKRTEEQVAIVRHDMRHYLQTVGELLRRGEQEQALEFIGAVTDSVDELKTVTYCENSTLDALLAAYLDNARTLGIRVEAKLDIPQQLPQNIDDMQLAAIFANGIENAINACTKLPPDRERVIEMTCMTRPRFAFEIRNTYEGEVLFDSNGLPITTQAGHGVGARSISAFAKRYNAILDFEADGQWFALRLVL